MTREEQKIVQKIQLEIMDEVHRICEENHVTYYIIGGTLLGAVRHGGFIPWDLDIDIAMKREDYMRFRDICMRTLDDRFFYQDCQTENKHLPPHALIVKKGTILEMKYDAVNPWWKKSGVYVDVFPLDNAPDDEVLREKQAKMLQRIRKLKAYRIPYSYSFSTGKRILHYLVSAGLSWFSIPQINRFQQTVMMKYAAQETECICSMASQYAYKKQCMPREIYGEPVLLEFEGRRYYAPEQHLEYLTRLYGDYMKLPPEEKRWSLLDTFVSLECT